MKGGGFLFKRILKIVVLEKKKNPVKTLLYFRFPRHFCNNEPGRRWLRAPLLALEHHISFFEILLKQECS